MQLVVVRSNHSRIRSGISMARARRQATGSFILSTIQLPWGSLLVIFENASWWMGLKHNQIHNKAYHLPQLKLLFV
jgi:hypothetical protein